MQLSKNQLQKDHDEFLKTGTTEFKRFLGMRLPQFDKNEAQQTRFKEFAFVVLFFLGVSAISLTVTEVTYKIRASQNAITCDSPIFHTQADAQNYHDHLPHYPLWYELKTNAQGKVCTTINYANTK